MARPLCVIGNANLDLVIGPLGDWPEPGTELFLPRSDFRIGGSAANTALALRRLGATSGLVSAAGEDVAGGMIARAFGGPLDRVARLPGPTGISVGVLHPGAERSFLSTAGHLDRLDIGFFLDRLADWPLAGGLALVSGVFALPALAADHGMLLAQLRRRGAEVAIDPGWPGPGWTDAARRLALGWLAGADHVLLNDKEATGLAGTADLPAAVAALVPAIDPGSRLVVKRGRAGALCAWAGGSAEVPAHRIEVFDTVGAGDAFNAGYLDAVARGLGPAAALARGTATAAAVIAAFPRTDTALSQTEATDAE